MPVQLQTLKDHPGLNVFSFHMYECAISWNALRAMTAATLCFAQEFSMFVWGLGLRLYPAYSGACVATYSLLWQGCNRLSRQYPRCSIHVF